MKTTKVQLVAIAAALTMGACLADSNITYEDPTDDLATTQWTDIDRVTDGWSGLTEDVIITPDVELPIGPPVEDPIEDPIEDPVERLVEADDLSPAEAERVEILRSAINVGLNLGQELYLDQMAIQLQNLDILSEYEISPLDLFAGLDVEAHECPFVEYYDNRFETRDISCDYLADMAKVEVYSSLTQELDDKPLSDEIIGSIHYEEAQFWYEQGAISALEDGRVRVRFDLMNRGLCSMHPTPVESSYIKGITIGRQHFAAAFNMELERRGFSGTYPDMPTIEICDASEAFIEPATSNALGTLGMAMEVEPLCATGYEPPDHEASLQYAQAQIDYERGVRQGISDEMALASVAAFQVIRCNVGDPLVIDLDGDGLELSNIANGVNFDLFNIGREQAIAWPVGGDGFLAYDWDGDGVITSGTELFGNIEDGWIDGFDHLASFDSDNDGAITKNDKIFSGLIVWQDINADALSTSDEMLALGEIGITAIPTIGEESNIVVNGNSVPLVAYTQGVTLLIGDAQLHIAPNPRLVRSSLLTLGGNLR